MDAEVWKPVVGYEGRYEVSNLGGIKSARGPVTPFLVQGYLKVNVYSGSGGARKQVPVHRLVALAFIGPQPEGMQVLHGDGVSTNNLLSNLSWGTPRANQADRVRHGTALRGESAPLALLTDAQAASLRADKRPSRLLATVYGVSQATVMNVRHGRTYGHSIGLINGAA